MVDQSDFDMLATLLHKSTELRLKKTLIGGYNSDGEEVYTKIMTIISKDGSEIELFFDENDNLI